MGIINLKLNIMNKKVKFIENKNILIKYSEKISNIISKIKIN